MKHIINLLGLALAFGAIFYTAYWVNAGDICRTIFGCFALWTWFNFVKKENTK